MGMLNLKDVEDELVRKLDERAQRNGRSAESEHREILRRVLLWEAPDPADIETLSWEERAALLRRLTAKRQQTPSEVLIREDRDSR